MSSYDWLTAASKRTNYLQKRWNTVCIYIFEIVCCRDQPHVKITMLLRMTLKFSSLAPISPVLRLQVCPTCWVYVVSIIENRFWVKLCHNTKGSSLNNNQAVTSSVAGPCGLRFQEDPADSILESLCRLRSITTHSELQVQAWNRQLQNLPTCCKVNDFPCHNKCLRLLTSSTKHAHTKCHSSWKQRRHDTIKRIKQNNRNQP